MRRGLALLVVNLVVFVAGAALIESGFRWAVEGYSDDLSFRATRPLPYRDAPYFSPEFLAESFRQPGGWRPIPSTNTILPNDFDGDYYHVENGIRRTTDVPAAARARIHLFGGSTIYNSEVPDEHTVASYLQRQLRHRGYDSYAVVNLGVTSVSTLQQVERLAVAELGAGDIIVFYDGVNDVLQGVLYGNPGDTIYGNDRSRPFHHKLLYRLAKNSIAVRHVLDRANANYKIADLDQRVSQTVARYRASLAAAESIAATRDVRFAHFLQPSLYSLAQHREYERKLLSFGFVPPQAEEAFGAAYPALREVVAGRAHQGGAEFDLTGIFDSLEESVYLDGWHINHVGNEVVASNILAGLETSGLLAGEPLESDIH